MADSLQNPFGGLIGQIQGLAQQKQSPESAALQFKLMQAIQEQTRQNLASDYLSSADFSRNPAASLRMLGSILNNPDLIRSSLDVQMKADAFELDKKRLQDLQAAIEAGDQSRIAGAAAAAGQQGLAIETLEQQGRERRGLALGQAVAGGERSAILEAAGTAGERELLQAGASQTLLSPEERKLQAAKIEQAEAEPGLTRAQTLRQLAEAKRLEETPIEKPMTAPQKANLVRQLSKDVKQSAPVKDFLEMRSQAAKVNDVLDSTQNMLNRNVKQQTALVTFQKMLDPLSVVRESEFIRTQQMQGLVDSIRSKIESAIKGGAVTDETIRSIREAVNIIGARAQKFANEEVEKGRDQASAAGIDNLDLVARKFDYFPEASESVSSQPLPVQTFQSPAGEISSDQLKDYLNKNIPK